MCTLANSAPLNMYFLIERIVFVLMIKMIYCMCLNSKSVGGMTKKQNCIYFAIFMILYRKCINSYMKIEKDTYRASFL
jgi:hypothetical protein